jgi:hypothetical protein
MYIIIKTFYTIKNKNMGNLLYLIAVILVIIWIFGAFVSPFGGGLIHILLVIAVIAILLRIIRGA